MSKAIPQPDSFVSRHIGPSDSDVRSMLDTLGYPTLDAFVDAVIPSSIRFRAALDVPGERSEQEALASFRAEMSGNEVWRSFIGMGYSGTHTPAVIQRNILENPGWYTAYTP
ncbi:MAG TPA: glycine dehydrogenase (aminomethyl-transferring), partial [Gemmatimonadaceae bacterium]|nr:glycine dehydrogenase (aminomethyl-transferring) [Gemmatimonadaceae bacterium]